MEERDQVTKQVEGAIGMTSSSSSMGKIMMLPPLIHLIIEYAKHYWLFECESQTYVFYDHWTRKIVHVNSVEHMDCRVIVTRASDRSLFMLSRLWGFDPDPAHLCIRKINYDLNCVTSRPWKFHKEDIIDASDMLLHIENCKNSIVHNQDSIFVRRKGIYQWIRFDLNRQQWDMDIISDPDRGSLLMSEYPSLTSTSIGPRSFVAIERSTYYTYRCIAYDGDSKNNGLKMMTMDEILIFRQSIPRRHPSVLTMGHIKDAGDDMVVIVFADDIIFKLSIKTRLPCLTFYPPMKIDQKNDNIIYNGQVNPNREYFIFDSTLWVFVEQHISQPLSCFRFSFDNRRWTQSGVVPHCLLTAKLFTMV
jgi:hypothetical protein